MVARKDILSNNKYLKQAGSGLTAVFVGATGGIGLGALQSLTKHTDSPTIYIVGRSISTLGPLIESLKALNSTATFHPIQGGDLTLVSSAATAADEIAKTASRVDLLIMTAGYVSFNREESTEGLDKVQAIQFYSRMRFLETLAPLLRKSPSPRVVSVLAGGQESMLDKNDLQQKNSHSAFGGGNASLLTLYLEEFARQPENSKIALLHIFPGVVGGTGLVIKGASAPLKFILDWIAAPLMRLIGYTPEEAGERVIFTATSGRFRRLAAGQSAEGTPLAQGYDGKPGSGVYLVVGNTDAVPANKDLSKMQDEGFAKIVYNDTQAVLAKIARN